MSDRQISKFTGSDPPDNPNALGLFSSNSRQENQPNRLFQSNNKQDNEFSHGFLSQSSSMSQSSFGQRTSFAQENVSKSANSSNKELYRQTITDFPTSNKLPTSDRQFTSDKRRDFGRYDRETVMEKRLKVGNYRDTKNESADKTLPSNRSSQQLPEATSRPPSRASLSSTHQNLASKIGSLNNSSTTLKAGPPPLPIRSKTTFLTTESGLSGVQEKRSIPPPLPIRSNTTSVTTKHNISNLHSLAQNPDLRVLIDGERIKSEQVLVLPKEDSKIDVFEKALGGGSGDQDLRALKNTQIMDMQKSQFFNSLEDLIWKDQVPEDRSLHRSISNKLDQILTVATQIQRSFLDDKTSANYKNAVTDLTSANQLRLKFKNLIETRKLQQNEKERLQAISLTSRTIPGFVSLENPVGRFCPLNSVVQVLHSIPNFRLIISQAQPKTNPIGKDEIIGAQVLVELKKVFRSLDSSHKIKVASVAKLFERLCVYVGNLTENYQQSGSEMFTQLIDSIANGMENVTMAEQLHGIFNVQSNIFFEADKDQTYPCNYLQLSPYWAKRKNINKYYLNLNEWMKDAEQQLNILTAPEILVIFVERNGACCGINSDKYTAVFEYGDIKLPVNSGYGIVYQPYKLLACNIQQGGTKAGHYWSNVRTGQNWIKFDDADVSDVREMNDRRLGFGERNGNVLTTPTAELLFYQKQGNVTQHNLTSSNYVNLPDPIAPQASQNQKTFVPFQLPKNPMPPTFTPLPSSTFSPFTSSTFSPANTPTPLHPNLAPLANTSTRKSISNQLASTLSLNLIPPESISSMSNNVQMPNLSMPRMNRTTSMPQLTVDNNQQSVSATPLYQPLNPLPLPNSMQTSLPSNSQNPGQTQHSVESILNQLKAIPSLNSILTTPNSSVTHASSVPNLLDDSIQTPTVANQSITRSFSENITPIEKFVSDMKEKYLGRLDRTQISYDWVFDSINNAFVQRNIIYRPALNNLLNGMLDFMVNTSTFDNPSQPLLLFIDLNSETGTIELHINEKCIPFIKHNMNRNIVGPELIFENLKPQSDYNDYEKQATGNRSEIIPKICNMLSSSFVVKMQDKVQHCRYEQKWNSMVRMEEEKFTINQSSINNSSTNITFKLDLSQFGMDEFDQDTIDLFSKTVHDLCLSKPNLTVTLNKKRLECKSFENFSKMFVGNQNVERNVFYTKVNQNWEIAVGPSDASPKQFSRVNNVSTPNGGPHVDFVLNQLSCELSGVCADDGVSFIQPYHLERNICLLINCKIDGALVNTKSGKLEKQLTSNDIAGVNFNSYFLNLIKNNPDIMDPIKQAIADEEQVQRLHGSTEEQEIDVRKERVTKLHKKLRDATKAGTLSGSKNCTLILVEGDSAKFFVESCDGAIDPTYFGILPMQGRVFNVRRAKEGRKVVKNKQIRALFESLDLDYSKTYENEADLNTLRYRHLSVLHDQDGLMFLGAIANALHTFWPNLLRHQFLEFLVLPQVSAIKGPKNEWFYSIGAFNEWKTTAGSGWKIRHLKSPANLSPHEAVTFFKNIDIHRIPFLVAEAEDDIAIETVFSKNKLEEHRLCLSEFLQKPPDERDNISFTKSIEEGSMKLESFSKNQLMLFEHEENLRSIPNVIDGFVPTQRKVFYTSSKILTDASIQEDVPTLSGHVRAATKYRHGPKSLDGVIIGMGQDFVGKGNFNFLIPHGQFGTRRQNGKDSGDPHYLAVSLNQVTKAMFCDNDRPLLHYLYQDKNQLEPTNYWPVIPTLLLIGASRIGSTYSTTIPCYKLENIIDNVKNWINSKALVPMTPHYNEFRGSIERLNSNHFVCSGEISIIGHDQIEVTELPVGLSINQYKEDVLPVILAKNPEILICEEHHMLGRIKFLFKFSAGGAIKMRESHKNLHKYFGLQSIIATTNMHAVDLNGGVVKFESPEDILKHFCEARKDAYNDRKRCLIEKCNAEIEKLEEIKKLVFLKFDDSWSVEERQKGIKQAEKLQRFWFQADPTKIWMEKWKKRGRTTITEEQTAFQEPEEVIVEQPQQPLIIEQYDYLMTALETRLDESLIPNFNNEQGKHLQRRAEIESMDWRQLWIDDLDQLKKSTDKQNKEDETKLKNLSSQFSAEELSKSFPNPKSIRIDPKIDSWKKKYPEQKKKPVLIQPTTIIAVNAPTNVNVPSTTNTVLTTTNVTSADDVKTDSTKSLFIGRLKPDETTTQQLTALFGKYGNISRIVLIGKCTFGFVEFEEQPVLGLDTIRNETHETYLNGSKIIVGPVIEQGAERTTLPTSSNSHPIQGRGRGQWPVRGVGRGQRAVRGIGKRQQRGRGQQRGGGRGQGQRDLSCYNCQQNGHLARDCPQPRKRNNLDGQSRGQKRGRGIARGTRRGNLQQAFGPTNYYNDQSIFQNQTQNDSENHQQSNSSSNNPSQQRQSLSPYKFSSNEQNLLRRSPSPPESHNSSQHESSRNSSRNESSSRRRSRSPSNSRSSRHESSRHSSRNESSSRHSSRNKSSSRRRSPSRSRSPSRKSTSGHKSRRRSHSDESSSKKRSHR